MCALSGGSCAEKRRSLPRIQTGQSGLLDTASAAVADALGLDPSELPQSFGGLNRTLSYASSVYSQPDTRPPGPGSVYSTPSDYASSPGNLLQQRLATVMADVLGLMAGDISPCDSFRELGGDQQTARQFSERCKTIGLSVRPDDVLACRTIAEVETVVAPLVISRPSTVTSPMIVSPLSIDSGARKPSHGSIQIQQPPSVPPKAPARMSRLARKNLTKASDETQKQHRKTPSSCREVEQILSLHSAVSQSVVVRPKAGPLEGRDVVLLTLANHSLSEPADCEIALLATYDITQLRSIRLSVEVNHMPKVLVLLRQMPLGQAGNINRRKLQTWVQNINEQTYEHIMTFNPEDLSQPSREYGRRSASLTVDLTTQEASSTELSLVSSSDETIPRQQDGDSEFFDLSPMQRLYFHAAIENGVSRRHSHGGEYRFNQSVLLRLKKNVDIVDLSAAIETVIGHHSMLRSRFRPDGLSWCQEIGQDVPYSYDFTTNIIGTYEEVEEIISIAQGMIDIQQGPVFAAHHFQTHNGDQMLYLVAHRLVVDHKSWSVIIDDLDELLTNGCLTSWGSLSFPSWVTQQKDHVETLEPSDLAAFQISPPSGDYWGIHDGHHTYGNTTATGFTIDAELVSMLGDNSGASWSDCSDMFIAALLLSFSRTFRDRPVPTLWNQEHERATLGTGGDISKSVGWFTSLCPLKLDICHDHDLFTVLNLTKRVHHSVGASSVPYFTASMMDAESAASFVSSYFPVELTFDFAGDMQDLEGENGFFERIPVPGDSLSSRTSDIGPGVRRISAFEISAVIDKGDIKFKFLYNRQFRQQEQIQRWICGCEALLNEALDRLKFPPPALLSSDIPFLETTSEGLAQLNGVILPALDIDPKNLMAMYPATEGQESILVNELLTPGSSNASVIYEFDTSHNYVDIGHICAAWQEIVDRHPVLRTIFIQSVSRTGLYDQLVIRRHSPNMLFLESNDSDSAIEAIEKTPPFHWVDGTPLHRLVICQAPRKALLKIECSQAICDHASIIVLFKGLEQAYMGQYLPKPSQFSYQEYLNRSKTTSQKTDFWKKQLHESQPCFFPTLTSSARDADSRLWENTIVNLPIPREDLAAFAVKHSIDVPAVLQVAWALVLRDYVGTEDICFGYRSSSRDIPVSGLKEAVGSFSTTLVCRLLVPGSRSIAETLQSTNARHQEASSYQLAAIGNLQHELGIKGRRIFNTCMSFGSTDMINELSPSKKFRYVKSKLSSEYDLSIDINLHAREVSVDVDQRILNPSQANIVAHAFGRALQIIIDSPERLIKEADLFSEHDHAQILNWNLLSQPSLCDQPVHELIARQASTNPDAQAICAWDGDFTYCALYDRSMALAGHLLTSGLKPQTPVPVIVDKSRWTVVAMLAVLYANAILVPVDAEAQSLFLWVTKAVGARAVLASDSVQRDLASLDLDLVIVNEYTVSAMSAQAAAAANPAKPKPTDVACILFDHGSPENHKGIAYSHRTLATACVSQGVALRICLSSRVMQLSSYSVDIALSELFTTLVNGGCVCVPSNQERLADFTGAVKRMRVNWSYMTPTLSRKLNPDDLLDLAVVCFRTRHLDVDTYTSWAGKASILLAYGPPDTFPLGLSAVEVKDVSTTQCIGNPFCGNFWVVSPEDHNRLMPVGAMGELIIGSPTLAQEIDLGEQSVLEWIRGIAAVQLGPGVCDTRLINTGQLVRYREEGLIEFVTSDLEADQIGWSNAQRSETESALRRCLGLGIDVAVETISFDDDVSPSSPVLAGFIELVDDLFHVGELSKLGRVTKTKEKLYLVKQMVDIGLREALPGHMIPTAYIPVKRLPVTPSLDVDRRELRNLVARLSRRQLLNLAENTAPLREHAMEFKSLPLTKPERQLRAIWSTVLELPESCIKSSDRFLSLGGDAVLAHRLVVNCRENNIIIPIVDVLRNLSLCELAERSVLMEPISDNIEFDLCNGLVTSTSHRTLGSNSSIESMTTGSSLSDKDELKDELKLTGPVARGKKMAKRLLSTERAGSPSLMHMMGIQMS